MNEQLQEQLTKLITKSLDTADKAGTWLEAEIPEVIQQLLLWKFWESITHCLIPVFFLSLYLGWLIKYRELVFGELEGGLVGAIGFMLLVLFPSVMFNLDWLQIKLAPKVYLIEYMADLVK